jgi:hypothetical protein
MKEQLYYHKCNDCLTPFSSIERHIDRCDCDGVVTFMGEVKGDNYIQTGNKPACDGRCTHACGPNCDCACGGANHGTGRMVQTVIKEGKVRAIGFSEEDMLRAYKYRGLKDYAIKMVEDNTDKWAAFRLRNKLNKIIAMRVFDPRLKALVDFIVANKKDA